MPAIEQEFGRGFLSTIFRYTTGYPRIIYVQVCGVNMVPSSKFDERDIQVTIPYALYRAVLKHIRVHHMQMSVEDFLVNAVQRHLGMTS